MCTKFTRECARDHTQGRDGKRESTIGQREDLGCGMVSLQSLASPMGALNLEDCFRAVTSRGNVAGPLYTHVEQSLDEGYPRSKGMALGVFSQGSSLRGLAEQVPYS